MSYDPREVEQLRKMIVAEQQKGKRRGKGKKKHSEELEGGFLGSLLSLGARFASRAVPTATRAATTAARSTAIVPYNAATAAARTAATSAAQTAARSGTSAALRRLGQLGTVASIGVPLGLSAYQAIDYEKQKQLGAQAQAQADAETARMVAEQQRQVDAEVAYLNEQRRLAELEAKAIEEQRKREAEAYDQFVKQQEAEQRRQAELEAQYQIQAQQQYEEMMRQQEIMIQKAIEARMGQFATPVAPARPTTVQTPSVPTAPPRPTAPPAAPPAQAPTDLSGLTARERRALQSLQGRGRGRRCGGMRGGNLYKDTVTAIREYFNPNNFGEEMVRPRGDVPTWNNEVESGKAYLLGALERMKPLRGKRYALPSGDQFRPYQWLEEIIDTEYHGPLAFIREVLEWITLAERTYN